MKVKLKKVYYCEYCKKHSLRPFLIHEKHCTLNPKRECRICGNKADLSPLVDKYSKQAGYERRADMAIVNVRQPQLEDILEDTEMQYGPCPACALAILRLVGLNKFPYEMGFDYEKLCKDWWDNKNSDMSEETYGL